MNTNGKIPPSLFMLVSLKQMLPSILFTLVESAGIIICMGWAVNIPPEIILSAKFGGFCGIIGMTTDSSIAIHKLAIANWHLDFFGCQIYMKNQKYNRMMIFGVASLNFLLLVPYAIFAHHSLVAWVTSEYRNSIVLILWNLARNVMCFISKFITITTGWEILNNKSGLENYILPIKASVPNNTKEIQQPESIEKAPIKEEVSLNFNANVSEPYDLNDQEDKSTTEYTQQRQQMEYGCKDILTSNICIVESEGWKDHT